MAAYPRAAVPATLTEKRIMKKEDCWCAADIVLQAVNCTRYQAFQFIAVRVIKS